MTQKELAYTEDAIGHEKSIISILEDSINKLEDEQLVSFMNSEVQNHVDTKERLMNLLEENVNE